MKKRIFKRATQTGAKLLFSILALLLVLTGCNTPTPTPPAEPETTGIEQPTEPGTEDGKTFFELENEIKAAYLSCLNKDWAPSDLISYFCGEYNGSYAFVMYNPAIARYPIVNGTENVGGVTISYHDKNKLYVYHKGMVYRMEEAYYCGLLTSDDLATIAEAYHRVYPEIMSLSKAQEADVKQQFLEKWSDSQLALEEVRLFEMGVYGQANAIYISPLVNSAAVISTETVGGYTFRYPNRFTKIWIYDGTTLYSLTEAYENGIITEDGLKSLYETYQNS